MNRNKNNSILDRPICRRADVRLMAVSEGDQVMVPCRVSSNPPIVNFQWFFNSSSNKVHYFVLFVQKY